MLAEVVKRVREPASTQVVQHVDRLVQRLASDEAAGKAVRPPHTVAGDRPFQSGVVGEAEKEAARKRVKH